MQKTILLSSHVSVARGNWRTGLHPVEHTIIPFNANRIVDRESKAGKNCSHACTHGGPSDCLVQLLRLNKVRHTPPRLEQNDPDR